MKSAQLTPTANPAKKNTSFFNKESEQGFFHPMAIGSSINEQPFFSKSRNNNDGIQTKLSIGQPNDVYEKEADSMADKVVQRLAQPEDMTKKEHAVQTKPFSTSFTPFVQRKCDHCEEEDKLQKKEKGNEKLVNGKLQKKPILESTAEPQDYDSLSLGEGPGEAVQRKCTECEKEEKLQKKSETQFTHLAPSNIEQSLSASKDSGSSLPVAIGKQMGHSFGADFSGVRIHHDSSAASMNKSLHAHAFTHGSDIYFNSGKYDVNSNPGKHLLAHELTHVVQQGAANTPTVQGDLWDDATGIYNAVTDTGKAAYQKGSDLVTAAADTLTDTSKTVYQQGAAIISSVEDKAKTIVDSARQKTNQVLDAVVHKGLDLSGLNNKKAQVLAQINIALHNISRRDAVYLTDDQIAAINNNLGSVREKSLGIINLPPISARGNEVNEVGLKPIAANTLTELLQNMQSVMQADFMSVAFDTQGTIQGSIQCFAPAIPIIAGLALAEILAIIAIFLIILLLLIAGPKIIDKEKKEQEEKEREKEREKEQKEKEEEEERKRKEEEEKQKKENDKNLGLPCIDVNALKVLNNVQGNLLINNLYSDNWVFFRKNVNENRKGKGTYCTDSAAIKADKRDFFLKIDKTFQHCLVMVCSPQGKIIAFSPGIKHASLTGGDVHAELNALPFIRIQLLKNPKDTIGARLFSVCFDFACDKSETSCVPQLQKFVNENLPGGSFQSDKSRDRSDMQDVCDNAFDDALKRACTPP
jgi:chemotaxis protein histidine kinase CheA